MKAKLVEAVDLAPGIRHFTFETGGEPLDFTPGQFVSLKESLNGSEYTRAYSLASAPDSNRFDLCLNLVPGGAFSAYLFTLKPGSEIELMPPLGYFTLRHPDRDAVMIATGTGVAPFRSMLHAHLRNMKGRVTLLFGTRYEESVLYGNEFREFERQYPNFQFWPTLTRATQNWQGRTGRVQSHLDEVLAGRSDLDVYLCGLKEMVDDVRRLLKAKGYDRKQIIYEKYD
jgi:CDP-4-dehydro-6-deoxyglucose reductase